MPKFHAKKVLTPGSKSHQSNGTKKTKKAKKVGRPSSASKVRRQLKHRASYTEADMMEAVRLVLEEGYCKSAAALKINARKKNEVPRMTLNNRLSKEDPNSKPSLGRPNELSSAVELALVKCLKMCAEFQYPLRKRDLQDLVQSYCIEHGVETRWEDDRPGKGWIRKFTKRWRHEVKVRKPANIKRSRAQVSPETVRSFFARLAPNLDGVEAAHVFNYDETNLRDDPREC